MVVAVMVVVVVMLVVVVIVDVMRSGECSRNHVMKPPLDKTPV